MSNLEVILNWSNRSRSHSTLAAFCSSVLYT